MIKFNRYAILVVDNTYEVIDRKNIFGEPLFSSEILEESEKHRDYLNEEYDKLMHNS